MSLRAALRARRARPLAARTRSEQGGAEPKMRLPGSLSSVPGRIQPVDQANDAEFAAAGGTKKQVCGRDSTQVSDFPQTYIKKVSIDLGLYENGMKIHWNRSTKETRALPSSFNISPGAGLCNLCCDDRKTSQDEGSLCTPKGNSEITRNACELGNTSWAKNASYFESGDSRGGIAIHSGYKGHVPSFPASHGCVRTTNEGSAVVHDNSSASAYRKDPEPTKVKVSGTWNGNRCYPSEKGKRRSRTKDERCKSSGGAKTEASPSETDETLVALNGPDLGPGSDDLAGPA